MNEDRPDLAAEVPAATPMSLPDYNLRNHINACVDCGRGGHTRTTLLRVILSISTGQLGYSCQEHAVKYLRPKDVKRKQK